MNRRIVVILFDNRFVDNPTPETNERPKDHTLKSRIEEDEELKHSFLTMLLEYRGRECPKSQSIINATLDYQLRNRDIGLLVSSRVCRKKGSVLKLGDVYKRILLPSRYCGTIEEWSLVPKTRQTLIKRQMEEVLDKMMRRGEKVEYGSHYSNGKNIRGYKGFEIIIEDEDNLMELDEEVDVATMNIPPYNPTPRREVDESLIENMLTTFHI